jgi:hypothetical protein
MSTNEWFTPPEYVQSVRMVLGRIDLDPASCDKANRNVRADRIYTEEDNGLMHPWYGRVFCNPPYGKTQQGKASNLEAFTRKLIEEYWLRHVTEAILLIPANTATSWFDLLWEFSICFPKSRIRFLQADGRPGDGVSFGTCFVYFGSNEADFSRVFSKYGHVVPASGAQKPIAQEIWAGGVA